MRAWVRDSPSIQASHAYAGKTGSPSSTGGMPCQTTGPRRPSRHEDSGPGSPGGASCSIPWRVCGSRFAARERWLRPAALRCWASVWKRRPGARTGPMRVRRRRPGVRSAGTQEAKSAQPEMRLAGPAAQPGAARGRHPQRGRCRPGRCRAGRRGGGPGAGLVAGRPRCRLADRAVPGVAGLAAAGRRPPAVADSPGIPPRAVFSSGCIVQV
jgi:hypothetical protein